MEGPTYPVVRTVSNGGVEKMEMVQPLNNTSNLNVLPADMDPLNCTVCTRTAPSIHTDRFSAHPTTHEDQLQEEMPSMKIQSSWTIVEATHACL